MDQSLFNGYAPAAAIHDEMFASANVARPQCAEFIAQMEAIGRSELSRRWEQAERLIRENGMVYNAYGDMEGNARPWNLDPLPLLIAADELRLLSAAMIQRARLLNHILADLYGPQNLLSGGQIPASLVFAHPGFRRAFHEPAARSEPFLHVYAADLARAADGRWWVVGDRTDAPMGMGYALENRIVVSRMLPGVIHHCQVERLASFFIALRESLQQLARTNRENPRIVLLSHGPGGPSFFEDAYLARYLGYTLAEGGDLTVRNNCVMLKTLGGLLQVDVILRRLSDQFCDPLEMRADASLGIPGLVQVVRAGKVAIANALGSSLVESPALVPFLPGLCRHLLSAELLMPSLATWWCGQTEPRQQVLERIGQLEVRSSFRVGRQESVPLEQLRRLSREELTARIQQNPEMFSAQEDVVRSRAPVWTKEGPRSRHVAVRMFAVATKDSYTVMPGALVRVAENSSQLGLSILAGEGSKDAWVISDKPVQKITLLQQPGQLIQLRRGGAELPSRVADNLFWLGRHIERVEGAARLLRPILNRLTSEADPDGMPELSELLRAAAAQGLIEPGFVVEGIKQQLPAIEQALPTAMLDAAQPGSLRSTTAAMYRNASLVRDRMSTDSWRILHRLEQQISVVARRRRVDLTDVLELLNTMVLNLAAYGGLVGESMTRTQAWRFLDLGRRVERSLHMIALVRGTLLRPVEHETAILEAVLEVADSLMTYRSRYLANMQLPMVLDLLLTDETNPRSLAFQLVQLAEHVERLPRDATLPERGPEQRIALSAVNMIRLAELRTLCDVDRGGERSKLNRLLVRLESNLPKLSDLISHKYLLHADVPRQLAGGGR